jgi:hypothetical protein
MKDHFLRLFAPINILQLELTRVKAKLDLLRVCGLNSYEPLDVAFGHSWWRLTFEMRGVTRLAGARPLD